MSSLSKPVSQFTAVGTTTRRKRLDHRWLMNQTQRLHQLPSIPKWMQKCDSKKYRCLKKTLKHLTSRLAIRRLQNAEISKRYDQCEVISKDIQEVRVQKCALESELAAFCWKERSLSGTNKRRGMKPNMGIRLVPNVVSQAVISTLLTRVTSLFHLLHHSLAHTLMLFDQLPQKLSVCRQQKSTHEEIAVIICGVRHELYVTTDHELKHFFC